MYWRRFAISSIPLDDAQSFDRWIRDRWLEKDDLLDYYMQHGRFPANADVDTLVTRDDPGTSTHEAGYIETEVRQRYWWEFVQIFVGIIPFSILAKLILVLWTRIF